MIFSSTTFLLLFLPLVIIVYYNPFFKGRKFKNMVLLIASLGFYAWGEPVFIFIMLAFIIINWLIVLQIDKNVKKSTRKKWLSLAIILDVGLMFIFKYLSFVLKNIGLLIDNNSLNIDIALPIGISFFTFQIMSYCFDVYYNKAPAQKKVLNVALYITLFPQLIAGPIVRYETIANEIENRKEIAEEFTTGMARFVYGLGKKVLIANYVGLIADNIFAEVGGDLSVASAWLGALAYTLQIYFDFSGYSDMAIGLGKIFGFHFDENFNYPYISRSITEFWRRWHISLSTWFRDYIYIPLGGNKVSKFRWILNIFVVWLLTGIWHGANWTFVFWGLFYFILLLIERLTGFTKKLKGFSHIYTLFFVVIAWVIFRANSLAEAATYIGTMFGINAYAFIDSPFLYYFDGGKWILLLAIIFSMPVVQWMKEHLFIKKALDFRLDGPSKYAQRICEVLSALSVLTVFILSLLVCVKSTYNPFIYFNF